MPNYIAGLLTSLVNGNVTAAILSDITHLGALLLFSDPIGNALDISINNIPSLVPKTIFQFGNITAEQWVTRIQAKSREISNNYTPIQARQQFLEIVEKWALFGAAFFFVRRAVTKKHTFLNSVIAVNRHGIRVLTNDTHEVLQHHALDEIESTNKYTLSDCHFLEIKLTYLASQKWDYEVVTIETELGEEMARLLGQYLYLSKENTKEPIYIASSK